VGQGVQDNQVRPPSVAVAELLDAVRRGFALPGRDGEEPALADYEKRLVVRHPLQPFSPRYFRPHAAGDRDARLFSHAAHYCEGARAMVQPGPAVLRGALDASAAGFEAGAELSIDHFERYLANPARAYLQLQLGVFLGDQAVQLEEREPIELDALESWGLGNELLGQDLATGAGAQLLARERARGRIPLGTPGLLALQGQLPMARAIVARGVELRAGSEPATRHVALDLGAVRLVGMLDGLSAAGRVQVQYSKVGGSNELKLWLRHLMLNAELAELPVGDPRRTSHMVARKKDKHPEPITVSYSAVPNARAELVKLVELVVHARAGALPLFKGASRAYADARRGKTPESALDKARQKFELDEMFTDLSDAHVRQLYPSFDAVLAVREPVSFEDASLALYEPLLSHRSDE